MTPTPLELFQKSSDLVAGPFPYYSIKINMIKNNNPATVNYVFFSDCVTYTGPTETKRKWADGPHECQFPFWYNGVEYNSCTTDGGISQPWCATAVMENTTTGNLDMIEGMWGYCGDCSGTTPPQCLPGGHNILGDSWRVTTTGLFLRSNSNMLCSFQFRSERKGIS